ncbi:hypothetical protein ACJX0J_021645, partial [Zea mays]
TIGKWGAKKIITPRGRSVIQRVSELINPVNEDWDEQLIIMMLPPQILKRAPLIGVGHENWINYLGIVYATTDAAVLAEALEEPSNFLHRLHRWFILGMRDILMYMDRTYGPDEEQNEDHSLVHYSTLLTSRYMKVGHVSSERKRIWLTAIWFQNQDSTCLLTIT